MHACISHHVDLKIIAVENYLLLVQLFASGIITAPILLIITTRLRTILPLVTARLSSSPMYLVQIQRNIAAKLYTSLTRMDADVQLMLDNCVKYNGPETLLSMVGDCFQLCILLNSY